MASLFLENGDVAGSAQVCVRHYLLSLPLLLEWPGNYTLGSLRCVWQSFLERRMERLWTAGDDEETL